MSEENPFDLSPSDAKEPIDVKDPVVDPDTGKSNTADKPAAKPRSRAKAKEKDEPLTNSYTHGKVYDERSNEIVGGVKIHNGIPVAYVQLANWIGDEQLLVSLDQLQDVKNVVDGLVDQVKSDKSE